MLTMLGDGDEFFLSVLRSSQGECLTSSTFGQQCKDPSTHRKEKKNQSIFVYAISNLVKEKNANRKISGYRRWPSLTMTVVILRRPVGGVDQASGPRSSSSGIVDPYKAYVEGVSTNCDPVSHTHSSVW